MSSKFIPAFAGFVFIAFSLSATAQSSGAAGTIDGLVTDPAGSVIPGAKVELNNQLSGLPSRHPDRRFRRVPLPQHPAESISGSGLRHRILHR